MALQEKFPRYESRGSGMVTSSIKAQSAEQQPPPVVIRPIAELRGHTGTITAAAFTENGTSIATSGNDARLKIWDASAGSLLRTIELDDGPATSLAILGSRALTGHTGGEIVLWDWEKAEKIATFKRNEAEVWSVTFTGRPDRFAASSHDWKVALWDTTDTQRAGSGLGCS